MANLSELTTFHVGGPAKATIFATTEADLISTLTECDAAGEALLIVGGGSNILVSDEGFDGTVLVVQTQGNTYEIDACSGGTLQVAAGVNWDELVEFACERGLANLESLSGIPGTVGGGVMGNIGAYGHELSEVIARVRTYDRLEGQITTFTADQCEFSYRNSVFKEAGDRFVILDATFQLRRSGNSLPIKYQELAEALAVPLNSRVPVREVRHAVLELRAKKGMLYCASQEAGLGNYWSAGSFFINPILNSADAARLPAGAPRWPQSDGSIKTSAAWLMENAGVKKGDQHNGAQISAHHVLALTNSGNATADDIVELARIVRTKVLRTYQITLVPEVRLVGLEL
jgi:UDP-N-acetylmuramate dehydrogenase